MAQTKFELPHEKLGISELAYNLAYGQGYRAASDKGAKTSYKKGSALRKAFDAGKRAAKK